MPNKIQWIETEMRIQARAAILASTDWLTATQIARLAESKGIRLRSKPAQWLRVRALFAIRMGGVNRFPQYGLDPSNGYQPYSVMADVIAIVGKKRNAWGIASWFVGANSHLGGQRPLDIIASEPTRVIAVAEISTQAPLHS